MELQPRQREAVKQIDDAVRLLSQSIAAERAVHAEFAARAPLNHSPFLPDLSGALAALGDRGRHDSTASKWELWRQLVAGRRRPAGPDEVAGRHGEIYEAAVAAARARAGSRPELHPAIAKG